jgi:hypothetical protein
MGSFDHRWMPCSETQNVAVVTMAKRAPDHVAQGQCATDLASTGADLRSLYLEATHRSVLLPAIHGRTLRVGLSRQYSAQREAVTSEYDETWLGNKQHSTVKGEKPVQMILMSGGERQDRDRSPGYPGFRQGLLKTPRCQGSGPTTAVDQNAVNAWTCDGAFVRACPPGEFRLFSSAA